MKTIDDNDVLQFLQKIPGTLHPPTELFLEEGHIWTNFNRDGISQLLDDVCHACLKIVSILLNQKNRQRKHVEFLNRNRTVNENFRKSHIVRESQRKHAEILKQRYKTKQMH